MSASLELSETHLVLDLDGDDRPTLGDLVAAGDLGHLGDVLRPCLAIVGGVGSQLAFDIERN